MVYFESVVKHVIVVLEDFMDLIGLIRSQDDHSILLGMTGFRKLVSNSKTAPIQSIIDANLLPDFL